MATVLPPPSKKAKLAALKPEDLTQVPHLLVQFQDAATNERTSTLTIPGMVTNKQLQALLNKILDNDEDLPYFFSLITETGVVDISTDLYTDVIKPNKKSTEDILTLTYTPEAVFRVRPISRCTSAIKGHAGTILCAQFSPSSSNRLVTGSGDFTARIWDCDTQTPQHTLQGHNNWVLCATYSPDSETIATGSMDNTVRLWDAKTGKPKGDALKSHTKWITSIAWEPVHLGTPGALRLASASKDSTIKIWDTVNRRAYLTLSGHTSTVSCIRWAGNNWLYSASHDRTIRIWNTEDGRVIHTLSAHSHWVNHMALSSDHILRTGPFDHTGVIPSSPADAKAKAKKRYEEALALAQGERLVTCSDDFTMFLWDPEKSLKPIERLLGHQKPVNHVTFSPDGRYIASASFDNHVKLWSARDGKFIASLRGHVAAVYQCAWSADSRLLVSSSKDTTLKVWDVRTKKLKADLPGHEDEVFAVDWSPDGVCVASGGKDKAVRLWRN